MKTTSKNTRWLVLVMAAASLLLIPFVGMKFSHEINWSGADFGIAAIMLFSAATAIEIALRLVSKNAHRLILIAVILVVLALLWAELAVGIFGSPFAGS